MKLYFFPVAPNPTKVRLYLAEKAEGGARMDVAEQLVNLREGEQRSPEHLARNPLARVPVLELDDGSCLLESLPIIEYLEELQPEPALIGRTPRERASVREIERIIDAGVLGGTSRVVHATNSPLGTPPSPEIALAFRGVRDKALAFVDDRLSDGRAFVTGSRPTIADCTLAAALQFGRFGKVELDPKFSHVARWDDAYRARPPAQAVLNL